jgi:hypothetical protein
MGRMDWKNAFVTVPYNGLVTAGLCTSLKMLMSSVGFPLALPQLQYCIDCVHLPFALVYTLNSLACSSRPKVTLWIYVQHSINVVYAYPISKN